MKIKVDQFCSLATSPSWQAWLYKYDANLYREFIAKLQESRGCSQNRTIMVDLLAQIGANHNGNVLLQDFINKNYPHMIENDDGSPVKIKRDESRTNDKVFVYYKPNALTYPRRMIFRDDPRKQIATFVLDKLKHDSIIVDGVGYVEYLTREDAAIADKIPNSNWQIVAYRMRSQK